MMHYSLLNFDTLQTAPSQQPPTLSKQTPTQNNSESHDFGSIKVGKNLPRLADVISDTDKGKGRFVRKNSLVENRPLYCLFYRTV
jgi:hypothetical protein